MCHHVHVKLTESDERAVKKLYGIMVPVYASVVLVLLAAFALTQPPRADKVLTADAAVPSVVAGPTR